MEVKLRYFPNWAVKFKYFDQDIFCCALPQLSFYNHLVKLKDKYSILFSFFSRYKPMFKYVIKCVKQVQQQVFLKFVTKHISSMSCCIFFFQFFITLFVFMHETGLNFFANIKKKTKKNQLNLLQRVKFTWTIGFKRLVLRIDQRAHLKRYHEP